MSHESIADCGLRIEDRPAPDDQYAPARRGRSRREWDAVDRETGIGKRETCGGSRRDVAHRRRMVEGSERSQVLRSRARRRWSSGSIRRSDLRRMVRTKTVAM